ncbi:hypothetical protein [Blastococcus sp. KM273129]|uniref:hypothetical protein n=1 Tax=Blastococcus sp. KM273129 TaxID=2570315 RepID=UPI001F23E843|nr:hypothetical protein [Blastococcus sp. KM273129]MCF6733629.1 hypothetical protein [Blastococcus sp. KM273129]
MHTHTRRRGTRRAHTLLTRIALAAGTILLLLFGAPGISQADDEQSPHHIFGCSYSDDFIASLTTYYYADGSFKISVEPTQYARDNGWTDYANRSRAMTNAIWHATQSCVPGLYNALADSIYQQIECHVWFGGLPNNNLRGYRTGDTWDFESTHLPLVNPGLRSYVDTACLSEDGVTEGNNQRFDFA